MGRQLKQNIMNRCTVFDKLEDGYGIKPENLTEREKAIIGLCTNDFLENEEQALCLQPVSTRTLDDNNEDVYCFGCGMDEQDGTYKYHRTVANGDEWYCTNCKDYHLH